MYLLSNLSGLSKTNLLYTELSGFITVGFVVDEIVDPEPDVAALIIFSKNSLPICIISVPTILPARFNSSNFSLTIFPHLDLKNSSPFCRISAPIFLPCATNSSNFSLPIFSHLVKSTVVLLVLPVVWVLPVVGLSFISGSAVGFSGICSVIKLRPILYFGGCFNALCCSRISLFSCSLISNKFFFILLILFYKCKYCTFFFVFVFTRLTPIIWRYRHNINIIFFSKHVSIFIFRSPCSFYIIFKILYHLCIL